MTENSTRVLSTRVTGEDYNKILKKCLELKICISDLTQYALMQFVENEKNSDLFETNEEEKNKLFEDLKQLEEENKNLTNKNNELIKRTRELENKLKTAQNETTKNNNAYLRTEKEINEIRNKIYELKESVKTNVYDKNNTQIKPLLKIIETL